MYPIYHYDPLLPCPYYDLALPCPARAVTVSVNVACRLVVVSRDHVQRNLCHFTGVGGML